jgi:hypothetical protein
MSVCKPNCVTGLPNFGAINDCDVTSLLASGEIAKIIFTKCDAGFVDVDDDAEWGTKLTEGDITIPFVGNGKLDETQESGEIRVGCQTVSTICKKPFEFTSYITDTTTQTDPTLYNDILKQRLGLTVSFLTCDGYLLINPDWVTTANIGLSLSMLKISQIFSGEADSKMYYKISGEITECRSLKRVKLSSDTLAVINAG